jgi:NAD(P)-dependent dehydrogenase (short-subunit alcohol dehydrogenase family)
MALVWLITGASSGLGYYLALHALAAGHKVIASVRSKTKSADAVQTIESHGGKVIELDVCKGNTIPDAAKQAESFYGHVDVLVNNAGYSLLGAVEDMRDDENYLQFETNFFGPLRLIRALLPSMRTRGGGTIVNVSSIAGQDGLPSCGLYAASKFALEGLSESLARELAPFNISVLVVEPGAFRTNFLTAAVKNETGLSEAYRGTPVDAVLGKFDSMQGTQVGDPVKGVARVFEVVTGEGQAGSLKGKILRLPLGSDCVARIEAKLQSLSHDLGAAREAALSTDY